MAIRSAANSRHVTAYIFLIAIAVLLMAPTYASADDFYVITSTYKTQKEAQEAAALHGGWVLNTNFYDKLTPNLYAVVRGPFKIQSDAAAQLASLQHYAEFSHSYVKDAGNINIQIKIGNKELSPQVLAALLGELRIDVSESEGASNPCEPQEPYRSISLSYVTLQRSYDEKKDQETYEPKDVELEIGGFWQIARTGEIDRMRICTE